MRRLATFGCMLLGLLGTPALAQTDYYNTDAGHPLQIEDAFPVERRAFEFQPAPIRIERKRGGVYHWEVEPEVAYGILPRMHVGIGLPVAFIDAGGGNSTAGLAGVDLSMLYNLNAETALPALAIGAGVVIPVGHLAPDATYGSVKAIMTRTFTWARFHVNGQYTIGEARPAEAGSGGVRLADAVASKGSRWLAGIGVDRAVPLRSFLVGGEVFAAAPLHDGDELEWNAAVGTRYQVSPRITVDAGVGRTLTGDDQAWHVTFGTALAVGLPWYP